jgi:hypothetical protein
MASDTTKEQVGRTTRATLRVTLTSGAVKGAAESEEHDKHAALIATPRQRTKLDFGRPSLQAGVTDDFSELPRDAQGKQLSVADDAETYSRYIEWLADYLYRPAVVPESEALTLNEAWPPMSGIAAAIVLYLWEHPSAEYPPVRYGGIPRPIHADYIHRAELSKILSRVPRFKDRRQLLNRFYTKLAEDLTTAR